jgi:hypothetical protein
MIHKRTYRVISSLLILLLFAGSGFAMSNCHMQMTMSSEHAAAFTSQMPVENASCCLNANQHNEIGQFNKFTVCNCQVPVQSNTELLTSSNVHFKVQVLFAYKKDTRTVPVRNSSAWYIPPSLSSDTQPLYLKNSTFLI